MNSRRGAIEIQFNWVFVIIVGSLILLFFVSIVKSTQKSSDQSLHVDIQEDLRNIISQSQVDVGTTRTIRIPKMEFEFKCGEMGIKKSSSAPLNLPYNTIFSPDLIKGREMIAYSKYWNMPYPAEYFLYLTSKQVRYNFVNSSTCTALCQTFLSSILNSLPANLTYQVVVEADDVTENNYYKERFVFINESPIVLDYPDLHSSLGDMDEDVSAINIVNPNMGVGEIEYYLNDDGDYKLHSTSAYLGFPMLLGAIISDPELYECNVEKALLKYDIMTTIYSNKTQYYKALFMSYAPQTYEWWCLQIYNRYDLSQAISILNQEISVNLFFEINEIATDVMDANEKAIIKSCPLIY